VSDDPSVFCVVLNWNGWKDTIACVAALRRVDYSRLDIVVVDNGSSDSSAENIRRVLPDVELIENGQNCGFSAGNNVGIRMALERGAEFVWLLNNDAFPEPGALMALVRKARAMPECGAVGSVLSYAHAPTTIQAWGGGRVNLWLGRPVHAVMAAPDDWFDYLTAASILLRSSVLRRIGLLDEDFFLYWEDTDLGFRMRNAGAKLCVAADSHVLHRENASTGRGSVRRQRFVVASGIRFLRKHAPEPWLSIPLYIGFEVVKNVLKLRPAQIWGTFGGIRDFFHRQAYLKAIRRT
jgi:GT2 family glycosyltransferase